MALPQTTKHYYLPKIDGSFSTLTLTSSPLPPVQANEALVKIHAVSLQARDLLIAQGAFPSDPNLIPCSDMAGEIVAVGEEVSDWVVGDRVCSNFFLDYVAGDLTPDTINSSLGAEVPGVLTEYRVLPVRALVRIPAHLSYAEASTLPCAALTAFNALRGPEPVKAGDTILIPGTSGVSMFALQFAVAMGAHAIVTSSSDEKLVQAKALGATHTLNYRTTPAWDIEVLKLTNGVGADLVLEFGGPETLERSMNATRMVGNIAIIAGAFGVKETPMPNIFMPIIMKSLRLRGITIGSVELFRQMNAFMSEHGIRPIIAKEFRFEEAQEAYTYLASQAQVGKVVIRI
ncbi:NAD-P-binding protein [Mycena rosella]|uniref:NAD-P-binding protein n=1 Tax=Mycena rosella TaxID=1033263 RepID=A0AAD7DYM4_MYCRO|nr:NAD-P-binding protein [Mycena rosella]